MGQLLPRAGRVGSKWGVTANGYGVSFEGEKKCSKIDCDDSCTTLNVLKTTELYT